MGELLDKAQAAATTLKALPRIFSDTLKGVKLALGVAKEMDSWAAFVKPILTNPLLAPKAPDKDMAKNDRDASVERDDEEDPMATFFGREGSRQRQGMRGRHQGQ